MHETHTWKMYPHVTHKAKYNRISLYIINTQQPLLKPIYRLNVLIYRIVMLNMVHGYIFLVVDKNYTNMFF